MAFLPQSTLSHMLYTPTAILPQLPPLPLTNGVFATVQLHTHGVLATFTPWHFATLNPPTHHWRFLPQSTLLVVLLLLVLAFSMLCLVVVLCDSTLPMHHVFVGTLRATHEVVALRQAAVERQAEVEALRQEAAEAAGEAATLRRRVGQLEADRERLRVAAERERRWNQLETEELARREKAEAPYHDGDSLPLRVRV